MNMETPRTDKAVKESNGQWSYPLRDTCQQLERELTEAKFDLQFRRDLYALQSKELAEAREDAMDHKHMLQSLSKTQALDRAELDRSFQYVIKQRDTLVEALERIVMLGQSMPDLSYEVEIAKQALAAVKGGSDE